MTNGAVEVITSVQRRRRWPRADKERIVPAALAKIARRSHWALEAWLREQRAKLSRQNKVAKAIAYSLTRWVALTRFLDDGRVCMSNNAAERAPPRSSGQAAHRAAPLELDLA